MKAWLTLEVCSDAFGSDKDGDGQGGLACYDSWGHKESDMTECLN